MLPRHFLCIEIKNLIQSKITAATNTELGCKSLSTVQREEPSQPQQGFLHL